MEKMKRRDVLKAGLAGALSLSVPGLTSSVYAGEEKDEYQGIRDNFINPMIDVYNRESIRADTKYGKIVKDKGVSKIRDLQRAIEEVPIEFLQNYRNMGSDEVAQYLEELNRKKGALNEKIDDNPDWRHESFSKAVPKWIKTRADVYEDMLDSGKYSLTEDQANKLNRTEDEMGEATLGALGWKGRFARRFVEADVAVKKKAINRFVDEEYRIASRD